MAEYNNCTFANIATKRSCTFSVVNFLTFSQMKKQQLWWATVIQVTVIVKKWLVKMKYEHLNNYLLFRIISKVR